MALGPLGFTVVPLKSVGKLVVVKLPMGRLVLPSLKLLAVMMSTVVPASGI